MKSLKDRIDHNKRDLKDKDETVLIKRRGRLVINGIAKIQDCASSVLIFGVSTLLLVLSGCISLLPKTSNPPKEVTLSFLDSTSMPQNDAQEASLNKLNTDFQRAINEKLILKVDKVIAAAPLQTQRILIISEEKSSEKGENKSQTTESDQTVEGEITNVTLTSHYLADIIWNESLVDLIQCRLVEELRKRSTFKGIGQAHEPFKADFLYLPALHRFEIQKTLDGSYSALVSLSLREVTSYNRELKREKIFSHQQRVSPSLKGFISGLDQAFLLVLQEAISWIETPLG